MRDCVEVLNAELHAKTTAQTVIASEVKQSDFQRARLLRHFVPRNDNWWVIANEVKQSQSMGSNNK